MHGVCGGVVLPADPIERSFPGLNHDNLSTYGLMNGPENTYRCILFDVRALLSGCEKAVRAAIVASSVRSDCEGQVCLDIRRLNHTAHESR